MTLNEIIQGDALTKLKELESESVDCCITSPPYWALRDYKSAPQIWNAVNGCPHEWITEETRQGNLGHDSGYNVKQTPTSTGIDYHNRVTYSDFCSKCNAWKGSLGLEPTFDLYIKHLIQIFNEVKRVLKRSGSCWVNMGDTYTGTGHKDGAAQDPKRNEERQGQLNALNHKVKGIPEKSLCLIPQRFQIAMIDQGWICRNTIIWWKPNCMPSSARDRFTVDFEYLFFFVKNPRYYFETQYEPLLYEENTNGRVMGGAKYGGVHVEDKRPLGPKIGGEKAALGGYCSAIYSGKPWEPSPLGRIKRCVWKIPTAPFSDAHFAVFPPAIVETPLKATCPEWICRKCGKPREKIMEFTGEYQSYWEYEIDPNLKKRMQVEHPNDGYKSGTKTGQVKQYKETGLSDCGCNAGFDGGIVLDPFLGSGTVALVALQNARKFVGIELNPEYIKMALARLDPYLKQQRITEFTT